MSWLRQHVRLGDVATRDVADRLTLAGLKVERVDALGGDLENVVIARVLEVEELTGFKKPIRWVTLTDGSEQRQVICGATNFAAGDVVAYARPPAMLPGGFRIERRPAYGRESDGMICSSRELGLGDDHTGILVLDANLTLGADVVDALGLRDEVLDLAVNPDRGYALSIRGVAREVGIAFGAEFDDPAAVDVEGAGSGYPVRIDDPSGCDRYVARLITGIDPTATSPSWLQRRLTLAGMRPISLAVDVTNHVMLELGQPLHAFDRVALRGDIVVRRASAGERIRTLDDVDRGLVPGSCAVQHCREGGVITRVEAKLLGRCVELDDLDQLRRDVGGRELLRERGEQRLLAGIVAGEQRVCGDDEAQIDGRVLRLGRDRLRVDAQRRLLVCIVEGSEGLARDPTEAQRDTFAIQSDAIGREHEDPRLDRDMTPQHTVATKSPRAAPLDQHLPFPIDQRTELKAHTRISGDTKSERRRVPLCGDRDGLALAIARKASRSNLDPRRSLRRFHVGITVTTANLDREHSSGEDRGARHRSSAAGT
jgi:tRNA-binding EMAP/Myf-like protein